MDTPAEPGAPSPRSVAARRRAALSDGTGHRPHLRLDPGAGSWRRRVLDDKIAADAAVAETSGHMADLIDRLGPSAGGRGRRGLRGPGDGGDDAGARGVGKLTIVALAVLVLILAPRVLGGVLAWASGGASVLFPLALAGFAVYLAGSRWHARRRAELAGEGIGAALAEMEADAAHRLRGIIDEWHLVDDTRGIGTLLERAYAEGLDAEAELGQTRRTVVDAIDRALARGYAALANLDGAGAGDPAGRLARIDAADGAYLQLRFYRRALETRG